MGKVYAISELSRSIDAPTREKLKLSGSIIRRALVCAGLLGLVIVWSILWPQTGDGDAITHFISARDGLREPWKLIGSWARVGAMLPLLGPAHFGLLAARWTSAIISILCAWQTMRLADDLGLKNAIWAGPLLIFQPLVFALAGDTMTELPMALGLVIAIRLWWKKRWLASALVMSYLPTVRPEGFFLCAMWGVLVMFTEGTGDIYQRLGLLTGLGTGTGLWMIAARIFCGDALFFLHSGWGWPANSQSLYGSGSFFSYINRLPFYGGVALFPLFLLGLRSLLRWPGLCLAGLLVIGLQFVTPPSAILPVAMLGILFGLAYVRRREKIAIAWWAFLLVLSVHSVLWWGGWFASAGLLRILACVSPVIAVICLRGFNDLSDWLDESANGYATQLAAPLSPSPGNPGEGRGEGLSVFSSGIGPHPNPLPDYRERGQKSLGRYSKPAGVGFPLRVIAKIAFVIAMALSAMDVYAIDPIHYRIFGIQKTVAYAKENHLLDGSPKLIIRDPITEAALNLPPNPQNILLALPDRTAELRQLAMAPAGSIGFWDDQRENDPHYVSKADLSNLGYQVIYEYEQTIRRPIPRMFGRDGFLDRQKFEVIKREE